MATNSIRAERDYEASRRARGLTGGEGANEEWMSRCRQAVADIAAYVARGDTVMAGEARRTLNELCWTSAGYPEFVRAALRAAGLREVVS
jgi:hypothetical protein